MTDRTLPHNLEAEKAALGACLVDDRSWSAVASRLKADDFFRDAHRRVYESMVRLTAARVALDPITLSADLRRTGELDEVGGPAYISSMTDGVPRASNVDHYAAIVAEHSRRRRLIAAANAVLQDAYDAERPAADVAADATRLLGDGATSAGKGPVSAQAAADAYITSVIDGVELVPTGYVDLDHLIGGLAVGDMAVVAARPSVGKTSMALGIARASALSGRVSPFFSLEMSARKIGARLLSWHARVSTHTMDRGAATEADHARVVDARNALAGLPLLVDDSARTVLEMGAWCRRLRNERGPLGVVVVDYLQLLTPAGRYHSRQEAIAEISRDLKRLAMDEQVALVALSQLSRAPEDRRDKRPQLSDLRESGALEQDADLALLLFRPEMHKPTDDNAGIAECIVAKNRMGPVGLRRLYFNSELAEFGNLAGGREGS